MKNLFLAILLIACLFLIFKVFQKLKINSFHAVVINYYVCLLTGLFFLGYMPQSTHFKADWLQFGVLTGSLFLPTFYLMGYTVEKVSVSVATVANKMSLIIPVVFSYFFLRKGPDTFSVYNIAGISLALLSIILTSISKKEPGYKEEKPDALLFLLPLALFVLGGTLDSMINFANFAYLKGSDHALFSLVMFATAAGFGTIAISVKMWREKQPIPLKDILGGILLGVPNFFSLYFFLKALSDFNNDGALLYPVINIGVIVTASLLAVILFKEKLSLINLAGIVLSAISLVLIFW